MQVTVLLRTSAGEKQRQFLEQRIIHFLGTSRPFGEREDDDIRIVLVGRTGAGKSATGNTILQKKLFQSQPSGASVTVRCQIQKTNYLKRKIVLVDTPGLFDTKLGQGEVTTEIIRCIHMSTPGPHIFLLVLRIDRFTNEEIQTFNSLFEIFGDKMSDFAIIVFTRLDDLEDDGITVQEYLKKSNKELKDFVERCQKRYIALNNKAKGEKKEDQISELMDLIIDIIKQNNGKHYTNQMYQEAEANLQQKLIEVKRLHDLERAKEIEQVQSTYKGQLDKIENTNKDLTIQLSQQKAQAQVLIAKKDETKKALKEIESGMMMLHKEHDEELLKEKAEKERQLRELQHREIQIQKLQNEQKETLSKLNRMRHKRQIVIETIEKTSAKNIEETVKQVIEKNNEQIQLMTIQINQREEEFQKRMIEKDTDHRKDLLHAAKTNKQLLQKLETHHNEEKETLLSTIQTLTEKADKTQEDYLNKISEQALGFSTQITNLRNYYDAKLDKKKDKSCTLS